MRPAKEYQSQHTEKGRNVTKIKDEGVSELNGPRKKFLPGNHSLGHNVPHSPKRLKLF